MHMENYSIVAESRDWLVADKPAGLPTVPLKSDAPGKDTLLSRVAKEYPEILDIGRNPWEGGVVHRLDTLTSGLVLIARSQRVFDALWDEQEHKKIVKDYLAVSSRRLAQLPVGFPPFPFGNVAEGRHLIRSLFRPYGEKARVVRPVSEECPSSWKAKSTGLWYETDVRYLGKDNDRDRFGCTITMGFRHQIRCHMAWSGYPLDGDATYRGAVEKPFGLRAVRISFVDPATGKIVRCQKKEGTDE
jgi:23S rRNA pseudouridine1911/1915/1917 synthase